MYDTIEAMPSVQSRSVDEPQKTGLTRLWQRLALGVVLIISIFMNFYQLGQDGFANLYYASAIRSMLDSWHNCLKILPSMPAHEVTANGSSAFYDWLYGIVAAFCEDASSYYEHGCH